METRLPEPEKIRMVATQTGNSYTGCKEVNFDNH